MPRYGNGTNPDINVFVGKKIRRRRRLLGLTQQQLAGTVGVRFQQVQKYECGANKVSAERLWQISEALEVPIGYFYEGYVEVNGSEPLAPEDADLLQAKETRQLVKAYYVLGEVPRRRLLQLAQSLHEEV